MSRLLALITTLTLSAAILPAQENDHKPRMIALGDSITKGVRGGVTAEQTFEAILAKALGEEIQNCGIGGERTDQALKRLDAQVIAAKPKFVLVMYGTNDSYVDQGKTESRITVDAYRKNLEAIVDKMRAEGIEAVLMTSPRWADDAKFNGIGENPNIALEPYIEACREVAAAKEVALIDHFEHWSQAAKSGRNLRDWTTDGCHPNPAGHEQIAKLALPVLKQLISTKNARRVVFSTMRRGPNRLESIIPFR